MRIVWLAAMGVVLAWSSLARAEERLGDFIIPPPVTVQPAPAGAVVRPVKLARVIIQLREGEPWASVRQNISRGKAAPLVWKNGKNDMEPSPYAQILAEEFRAAGFKAEGDTMFDTGGSADLQLGILIDDMKGRFCNGCDLGGHLGKIRGGVLMKGQWQVYSALERRVVASFQTTGGYETDVGQAGNELRICMEAFRENVRQLLTNADFRALLTQSASVPTTRRSAGPTILLDGASTNANRSIAEAVAVSPAIFTADGMGSGFLISQDGYLLTNQHVVGASKYVKVRWSDGTETLGEVVRTNSARDVALVKTDAHGRKPLGVASAPPAVGDPVTAIGTPLDESLQGTVTRGVVSALRRIDGQAFLQSDVLINHGNSGGPLLNGKGVVVAMAVSGIQLGEAPAGLNFFIPIDDALTVLGLKTAP